MRARPKAAQGGPKAAQGGPKARVDKQTLDGNVTKDHKRAMALTPAEKQARYRNREKLKLAALAEGNVTDIATTVKAASVEWLETTRAAIDAELAARATAVQAKKRGRLQDHPNWGMM